MHLRSDIADVQDAFVGREHEIALLGDVRRTAAAGRGSILLVGGEAGVGKSRLLREFERQKTSGVTSFGSASCVEFVQAPLGPLRALLQAVNRLGTRDPMTTALIERLAFERHVDATETRAGGWLFESIDAALVRYAQRGTVILLLEDVHWADRSTLAFLAYLADRITARRLLVVATYRNDLLDGDSDRMASIATLLSKGSVSNVGIARLHEAATQALVESKLPHRDALAPEIVSEIVRRSQGNAFFAEELVKHALDWPSRDEQLPLSIRSAVLARTAQLNQAQRTVMSLAAVLGQRFSIERLVAISDSPRNDVLSALEGARKLQLLEERADAPGELSFRHALTCEVLYGELLGERVRPLHEAIGLELEGRPDRAAVSVELAHHWWRAGDRARAATYAELAGDRAAGVGAMVDALTYYQHALSLLKVGDAQIAGLEHKIGVVLGGLGRLRAGIRRLEHAGELYWAAEDIDGFATNASALGALLYNAGETEDAISLYRRTIAALATKLAGETVDLLRARMAYDCVAALDFDSAVALVDEIAQPITDPMTAAHAYQTRFKVDAMRRSSERWRTDVQLALDAARRISDNGYRLYLTQCQVALDSVGLGEIGLAREHFEQALSPKLTPYARPRVLALAASSLEHTLRGDFVTAQALLTQADAGVQESYTVLVHIKIATLALAICTGDDRRLRHENVDAFLRYGAEHGMKLAMGLVGGPWAWLLGMRGDTEEAAAWSHRLAQVLPAPHRFMFAFLAIARYGAEGDVVVMRRMLADAASRSAMLVDRAVLALFDAFAGERRVIDCDTHERALDAAAAFQSIGWPWLAAQSFEAGGELKRALDIYRAIGARGDLRRIEAGRSDAAAGVLSARERQVAELAGAGRSNDEIAQLLHISPRTVEKHVSSALEKLQLRSRVQLGRLLLADGAGPRGSLSARPDAPL